MNSFSRTYPSENRNLAIVMGGSMAGLAAARVLSDRYKKVLLFEQDRFENGVEHRRGVPQSRHTHGPLAGGRHALERLFPGLFEELMTVGAEKCCITRDAHWCFNRGEHVQFESDLEGVLVSRPLLERTVRERVRGLPTVCFRDDCRVKELTTSSNNRCVTGIRVSGETIQADLGCRRDRPRITLTGLAG